MNVTCSYRRNLILSKLIKHSHEKLKLKKPVCQSRLRTEPQNYNKIYSGVKTSRDKYFAICSFVTDFVNQCVVVKLARGYVVLGSSGHLIPRVTDNWSENPRHIHHLYFCDIEVGQWCAITAKEYGPHLSETSRELYFDKFSRFPFQDLSVVAK
jgi:hypothetical protein